MTTSELRGAITEAARVLAALGLVDAFGHVSARSRDSVMITPPTSLAEVDEADLVTVAVDAEELPAAAPPETWLHLAVYRVRPDVVAVARAHPESTLAAGACVDSLDPLHGQASWLGRRVPVHPVPRLLRTTALASHAAASLGGADAMVLRGNGAVTTGASPGVAVARMYLLDAACRVWATAAEPKPLEEEDIAAWRTVAPPLLDRLWSHLARTNAEGRA